MPVQPPARRRSGGGGQIFGSLISSALSISAQEENQRRQISANRASERRRAQTRAEEQDRLLQLQQQQILRSGIAEISRQEALGTITQELPENLRDNPPTSFTTSPVFFGVDPNAINVENFNQRTFFSQAVIDRAQQDLDPFPGDEPLDVESFSVRDLQRLQTAPASTQRRARIYGPQIQQALADAASASDLPIGTALADFNQAVAGGQPTAGDLETLQRAIAGAAGRRGREDTDLAQAQRQETLIADEGVRSANFANRARINADGTYTIEQPSETTILDLTNIQTERLRGTGSDLDEAIKTVIPDGAENMQARRNTARDIMENTTRVGRATGSGLSSGFESLHTRALSLTRDSAGFRLALNQFGTQVEFALREDKDLRQGFVDAFGLQNGDGSPLSRNDAIAGRLFDQLATDPIASVAWAVATGATDVDVGQLYRQFGQQITRYQAAVGSLNQDETLLIGDKFWDHFERFLQLTGGLADFGLDGTPEGGSAAIQDMRDLHTAVRNRGSLSVDDSIAESEAIQSNPRTRNVANTEELLERINAGGGQPNVIREIVEQSGEGVDAVSKWFDETAYPDLEPYQAGARSMAQAWFTLGEGGPQKDIRRGFLRIIEAESAAELTTALRATSEVLDDQLLIIMKRSGDQRRETIEAIWNTFITGLNKDAVDWGKNEATFQAWETGQGGKFQMMVAYEMMRSRFPNPLVAENRVNVQLNRPPGFRRQGYDLGDDPEERPTLGAT